MGMAWLLMLLLLLVELLLAGQDQSAGGSVLLSFFFCRIGWLIASLDAPAAFLFLRPPKPKNGLCAGGATAPKPPQLLPNQL